MFCVTRPSGERIREYLASRRDLPFSYPQPGYSRSGTPSGYTADHHRVRIGKGEKAFIRAAEALRRWKMFDLNWMTLCGSTAPIEEGTTVIVLARHFGIWSLNPCRVVYTVDEQGETSKYGFAYGTLPGHAQVGEERFTVQWHRADQSVWYDLYAFSRPAPPLAGAKYPLTRLVQKRFARGSQRAMIQAVRSPECQRPLPNTDRGRSTQTSGIENQL